MLFFYIPFYYSSLIFFYIWVFLVFFSILVVIIICKTSVSLEGRFINDYPFVKRMSGFLFSLILIRNISNS